MNLMKKNNFKLIHLHIGKTGGMTFRNILKNKYKNKLIYLTINKNHSHNNNPMFIDKFINCR